MEFIFSSLKLLIFSLVEFLFAFLTLLSAMPSLSYHSSLSKMTPERLQGWNRDPLKILSVWRRERLHFLTSKPPCFKALPSHRTWNFTVLCCYIWYSFGACEGLKIWVAKWWEVTPQPLTGHRRITGGWKNKEELKERMLVCHPQKAGCRDVWKPASQMGMRNVINNLRVELQCAAMWNVFPAAVKPKSNNKPQKCL